MTHQAIARQLQLLIAVADDLPTYLAPYRALRARKQAKLAAGVGAAASAVVGGALWMANIGVWASLGTALGLTAIPLWVGGRLLLGGTAKSPAPAQANDQQLKQVALTLVCFQMIAEADGNISDEERLLLRAATLQFPLRDADRRRLEQIDTQTAFADAESLSPLVRQQVLLGCWMLAEADGVTEEEELQFAELVAKLGDGAQVAQLKAESRELQALNNELVTAMFRVCQQVLQPALGAADANAFLESLASIAATPAVRRGLRNNLSGGFSAGGVIQAIERHPERARLVAQGQNAVRAVYLEPSEQSAANGRLLALTDGSTLSRAEAKRICSDVDQLFDDLAATPSEAE
ncbi:MAG: TerB family tellurite resistance protein [Deltaproteobacteria bacterium]|nr:TerB family tellurite resistance protein [Deltaproteobacteria bacterium]